MKGIIYVEYAILIVISIAAAYLAYISLFPAFEKVQQSLNLESSINQLNFLVSIIEDVSKEAVGSYRKVNLEVKDGFLYVDNVSNSLIFETKVYKDIISSSLFQRFGKVYLTYGEKTKVYESENEVILENDFLIFNVSKNFSFEEGGKVIIPTSLYSKVLQKTIFNNLSISLAITILATFSLGNEESTTLSEIIEIPEIQKDFEFLKDNTLKITLYNSTYNVSREIFFELPNYGDFVRIFTVGEFGIETSINTSQFVLSFFNNNSYCFQNEEIVIFYFSKNNFTLMNSQRPSFENIDSLLYFSLTNANCNDILSKSYQIQEYQTFLTPLGNVDLILPQKLKVQLKYSNPKIIIQNFERLPKGFYEIYVVKVGEIDRRAIIYVGTKRV